AGQNMQPLAVDQFGSATLDLAQRRDAPIPDRNIGQPLAVMVDHGGVLENRVVLRHVSWSRLGWSGPVLEAPGLACPSHLRLISAARGSTNSGVPYGHHPARRPRPVPLFR